jgi:hypothetical protein
VTGSKNAIFKDDAMNSDYRGNRGSCRAGLLTVMTALAVLATATACSGSVTLPTHLDFSSPRFQDAERACKSLIPAGMFPSGS